MTAFCVAAFKTTPKCANVSVLHHFLAFSNCLFSVIFDYSCFGGLAK
jgi:hypothetical protein